MVVVGVNSLIVNCDNDGEGDSGNEIDDSNGEIKMKITIKTETDDHSDVVNVDESDKNVKNKNCH